MTLRDLDPSRPGSPGNPGSPSQKARLPDLIVSVGPLALSVAVGVTVMLWAILWWKPPAVDLTTLSYPGINGVHPERDMVAYLGGGVVAIALYVFVSLCADRYPNASRAPSRRLLELAAPVMGLLVTVAATAGFLRFRGEVMAGVRRPVKYLLVFGTLTAAGLVAAWLCRETTAGNRADPTDLDPTGDEPVRGRLRLGVLDLGVAVAVCLLLYVPGWRFLAGNAFSEYFLHLDFFAVGPALAFRHGAALGTDVHLYYGLGWPVLVSALGVVGRLGYGRLIQLETIYGCIYFVGVYALVRMLAGSRLWAVAGTALGILLSLFAGYSASFVMWRFPPATVLRWAFDVWLFLSAWSYLRTGKPRWLLAAGGLVGLAVFFQTDTGAYLAAAFAFFCACTFRLGKGPRPGTGLMVRAWALGAGVLVVGIAVASRLTAFTGLDFWRGWLENLQLSVMGATLLPLTGTPGGRPIVMFVLMTAVYLAVAGYAVRQMVLHRLTPTIALLGTVAVYGFLTLGYFVGRSDPHNLFRPAVPFAIVVAGCGGVATSAARRRAAEVGERWRTGAVRAARAVPAVAAAVAVVMLAVHPGMGTYPNVFGPEWTLAADASRCLQLEPKDICGIPVAQEAAAADIRAVVARIEAEPGPRPEVAVLDEFGPVIHLLADDRPNGLYQPMFSSMFTHHQLGEAVRQLERDPPDLVVMRSAADHAPFSDDLWRAFRAVVEQRFVFDSRYGAYEVWRRPPAG